jgi:plasmid replication initiation protein
MQTSLFEVTTPETMGVTPRYVLQHNAITRSAHNFSATAKKLTAMAMALLPADLSSLSVAFTFTEFCNAIGYTKSGESFALFKDAVKECMESVIKIETPPDKKGKTNWEMYHWFQFAKFDKDSGVCTMLFDQQLADFLKELKWLYSKINLKDLGGLQSRYALRIYELAISYASLQGKDGNASKTWYFERTIPEFRQLFGISPDQYQENWLFRLKVIDGPVKEINEAGIGITITVEVVKQGRNIVGICLHCKQVPPTIPAKRGRGRPRKTETPPIGQPELPEAKLKTARTRKAKELEHLQERYPQEFAELYTAELAKPSWIPADSEVRKQAAKGAAQVILRKKHGIVK